MHIKAQVPSSQIPRRIRAFGNSVTTPQGPIKQGRDGRILVARVVERFRRAAAVVVARVIEDGGVVGDRGGDDWAGEVLDYRACGCSCGGCGGCGGEWRGCAAGAEDHDAGAGRCDAITAGSVFGDCGGGAGWVVSSVKAFRAFVARSKRAGAGRAGRLGAGCCSGCESAWYYRVGRGKTYAVTNSVTVEVGAVIVLPRAKDVDVVVRLLLDDQATLFLCFA